MAMKLPPNFTKGRHSSASTFSLATARLVTMSKLSRYSGGASSARRQTHSTFSRPRRETVSCRKSHRFCWLSSSVKRASDFSIASGRPGKPAPVPTSSTRAPEKSA